MKHKVIKDFHLMGEDKKIITLKSNSIIEDYIFRKGSSSEILVGQEAVEKNPDFFEILDWKMELVTYMKQNKIPQPSVLAKKIQPFIQEMFIVNAPTITKSFTINDSKVKELEFKLNESYNIISGQSAIIDSFNNKSHELKDKEFELLELGEKINKEIIDLKSILSIIEEKEKELSQIFIPEDKKEEIKRNSGWDGVYRGVH